MKKLLLLVAIAIATCAVIVRSGRAEAGMVPPAQYAAALHVVREKLDAAAISVDNNEDIDHEMPGDTAKRDLNGIKSIRLPDGGIERVDTSSICAAITAADNAKTADDQGAAYRGISRRIGLIEAEVDARFGDAGDGKKPGLPPPDKSRDLARRILNEPAYASEPVPPPSWLDRKMEAFGKWLDNAINKLLKRPTRNVNMPPVNPKVWYTLLWIVIGALFVLLVWLIATTIGRRQRRAKPLALSDTEEALMEARDKDTLITIAEKHAKSGDYRAAFRLVYLATLIALDTDGILRFDRSKTNWEYVRQLRNSGRIDVYEVLAPMTRDFDRIWYGLSPTTPDVYRRAVIEYEKLTTPVEAAA